MTKEDLIETLKNENDGKLFISKRRLSKVLGLAPKRIDQLLDDVPTQTSAEMRRQNSETTHYYFISDVADAILKKGV